MLNRSINVLILALVTVTISTGQEQRSSRQTESLASENILLLTVAQPNAPVSLQEARLSWSAGGGELQVSCNIQNVGGKPIRHVTPVIWTSLGTGGTLRPVQPKNGLLMPGDLIRNGSSALSVSSELRETLEGPIKVLVVLMVERVTFADGSVYSDDKTSKALLHYFEDLSDKIERLQDVDRVAAKPKPR
jgi:hypothetical protein